MASFAIQQLYEIIGTAVTFQQQCHLVLSNLNYTYRQREKVRKNF